MRVLVTGGSSFLGAALVRQLVERDHDVRVLARNPSLARRLDGLGTRIWFCPGDVRDAQAVSRGAAGCDAVLHAAYAPVSAPAREILDVAVHGMAVVLGACERHGISRLMLVSSPWADGETVYGYGKRACERMAADWADEDAPRQVAIVRPFNPYGPDMGTDHVIPQFALRMARLAREQPEGVIAFPVRGSGKDLRSFTWIADCARWLCDLLDSTLAYDGPGRHDVGTDDVRTIASVAHDVAACFGRVITVDPAYAHGQPGSPGTARAASRQVPQAGQPSCVSFAEGLARTVDWYREHEKEVTGG
jgi:nucleoside-diphosphate-sugar epimerase